MSHRSVPVYPLSAQSRIAVGLQILKCVLIPFVPETLRRAGIDPLSRLPPSSPVLKHGFDLDARAGLRMLNECQFLFSDRPDELMSLIKPLSRKRDQWAHQQHLTQSDASAFLLAASDLCLRLDFEPEARTCRQLCQPPSQNLDLEWYVDTWEPEHETTIGAFEKALFDRAELSDRAALHKALVWAAADDWMKGTRRSAFFVLDAQTTDDYKEIGLPIRSLWWLFGLSHKAPVDIRRAAYLAHANSLD